MTPDINLKTKPAPVSVIHDFKSKLSQPSLLSRVKAYVLWQAHLREQLLEGREIEQLLRTPPPGSPISINLDLTTACNYACDHCVDMENLNTGMKFDHDCLKQSLTRLAEGGLRSVIVIGGGEPTLYPRFGEIIRLLKSLKLQVGIVSNGTGNAKVAEIADCLEERDWVRLSLDSGLDKTFQAMHKPKHPITLKEICAGIPPIKAINPRFSIGFSFIMVWKGAEGNDQKIVENVSEAVEAARLARDHQFDYIAFKPFLARTTDSHGEVINIDEEASERIVAVLGSEVAKAKKLETESFKVIESTNLRVLLTSTQDQYLRQPQTCHMTFFRQVVHPAGVFNCPVYRNVPEAKLGDQKAYSRLQGLELTQSSAVANVQSFDASKKCREVTCLYNSANWWIEDLIEDPKRLDAIEPSTEKWDHFL